MRLIYPPLLLVAVGLAFSTTVTRAAVGEPVMARDFAPGPPNGMSLLSSVFEEVNGQLLFQVKDASGQQLWRSNGTLKGTVPVKKLTGLPGASDRAGRVGNVLFYRQAFGVTGEKLIRTDGTAGGTSIHLDFTRYTPNAVNVETAFTGGRIYFILQDGDSYDLYLSTGAGSATKVREFLKSEFPDYVGGLRVLGGDVLFNASSVVFVPGDPGNPFSPGVLQGNTELWRSDGTAAGTLMVKDFGPATASVTQEAFGNEKAMTVIPFQPYDARPFRLWFTDGTSAGTREVVDLGPDPTAMNGAGDGPGNYLSAGGTLYFTFETVGHGTELWSTDGTPAGTGLVSDIRPGPESSFPGVLAAVGNSIFFTADDGSGRALWKATGGGVVLAHDPGLPAPGIVGTQRNVVGSDFYFTVRSAQGGAGTWQFWRTSADGAPVRLDSGDTAISVRDFQRVGPRMLFVGTTPETGTELGALDLGEPWPGNLAPVAVDDVMQSSVPHFDVLANDSDGDFGDSLTVMSVTDGAAGSVAIESDGTLTYTAGGDFTGKDSFNYVVQDFRGATDMGKVTVLDLLTYYARSKFSGAVRDANGRVVGTVNFAVASRGAGSGTLLLDGVIHKFKGTLGTDGAFTALVESAAGDLSVVLNLNDDTTEIAGSISVGAVTWTVPRLARAAFSAKSPSPDQGSHVFVSSGRTFDTTTPAPTAGYLHGTLIVDAGGTVRLIAIGADGVKVTAGGVLTAGDIAAFQGVVGYKTKGWFAGQLSLNPVSSFDLGGEFTWQKPAQAIATGIYPEGFHVRYTLRGFRWPAPVPGRLPSPLPFAGGTVPFISFGGASQSWMASLPAKLTVFSPNPDPLATSITLESTTGLVTGTYKAEDGKRYPFSAVLLPRSTFLGKILGVRVGPTEAKAVTLF